MQNPLHKLPMFHPAVPQGTFSRGFFKGATSGALMMGIFSSVMGVAGVVGLISNPITLTYALTTIALGSFSTGLFSGVMATQRSVESFHGANTLARPAFAREPVRAPEQSVAPAPGQGQWAERVGRSGGQDRLSQIIADGSLSDADRASAILREREQATQANR